MIWLNTERCCFTPPIASDAAARLTVSVAPPALSAVAWSIASATADELPLVRTTRAWNTPGATDDAGRFSFCTARHVAGFAHSEPAPE